MRTKAIVFGVVYCMIASVFLIEVAKTGYVLPADVSPPEGWPFTKRSREIYNPQDANLKNVLSYFR